MRTKNDLQAVGLKRPALELQISNVSGAPESRRYQTYRSTEGAGHVSMARKSDKTSDFF